MRSPGRRTRQTRKIGVNHSICVSIDEERMEACISIELECFLGVLVWIWHGWHFSRFDVFFGYGF